ncbi:MAG: hypothetical protein KGD73_12745 [Candidatus Lokiarchaeota archaeon]|nr:hypothetical protein [Candidatus Lokiarchaeota archaeon]
MGIKEELSELGKGMAKLTSELHETNTTMRESMRLMADSMKEFSETFSKTLAETMKSFEDMKIQIDIRDTVLKSLGIDGVIPDFFKKRK